MRLGKKKAPQYRIVVVDGRVRRDGRVIETIGKYRPKEDPSFMEVDAERVGYWLGVGAQPTEPVRAILRVTGDWQRFRGEPAPEPMRTRAASPDKKAIFDAAAKEAAGQDEPEATTPKRRTAKKTAAKKAAATTAEPGESGGAAPGAATAEASEGKTAAERSGGEAEAAPAEGATAAGGAPAEQPEGGEPAGTDES
jgi:small subunit ribosomal protein S16